MKSPLDGLPNSGRLETFLKRKSGSSRLPTSSAPMTSVSTARKASVFFSSLAVMRPRNLRDFRVSRNARAVASQRHRGFEDLDGLADYPHALGLARADLELHV